MSDPKLEIVWRKSESSGPSACDYVYPDYVSTDGRWRIIHAKRSESKQWELYDLAHCRWEGDWRTLSAAKDKARIAVRREVVR